MLETLHITNYALISEADISFGPGFNVITGETGAGKSIILGALSLLLGGKTDSRVLSTQDGKSVVEATFSVTGYDNLKTFCSDNDVEWDDEQLIIRREISPAGRSRAFINDSPVNLSIMRSVAEQLVDIHSQHQNLLLAQPNYQLQIIDVLAGNTAKLQAFQARYNALRTALSKLKKTRLRIEKNRNDEEFLRYQLNQITELNLLPGELAELERDRELMAGMAEIQENASSIENSLISGDTNVSQLLEKAIEAIEKLDSISALNVSELQARLKSAQIEVQDIGETVAQALEQLPSSPADLEQTEQRISEITDLCHRFNVETSDELISIGQQLKLKIDELEDAETTIQELEKEARRALSLAKQAAAELTLSRKAQATALEKELADKAQGLGMRNLRCELQVTPAEMSATGSDAVNFMFAFNKNQQLLPVGQTASGGEISRLMLVLKSIVASKMQLPAIIFDEVDTGVSGEIAARMGQLMHQMAQSLQVTAITHLPQVASQADTHFKVYKEDDEHATHTHISLLDAEQRVQEIAGMLAAGEITDAAIKNARSLMDHHS